MMTLPTPTEVQEIMDYLCQQTDRFNQKNGLPAGSSRRHYLRVAENAKQIASRTPSLNPEKAYVLGLLHDYGECLEQKDSHQFHGTAGFDEMTYLGFDEVARACLSHSFFDGDIRPENYPSYDTESIKRAASLLTASPLDDYDRLIQLSDLMVAGDVLTTIEARLDFVARKYHLPAELIAAKATKARELKAYFDALCGEDVYHILGVSA